MSARVLCMSSIRLPEQSKLSAGNRIGNGLKRVHDRELA